NAGRDRGLARRILPLSGGQDLAHDDLVDTGSLDTGPLQRRLDRQLAKLVRREIGKGPVEASDRRARGAHDDDVVLHVKNSSVPGPEAIECVPVYVALRAGQR